MPLQYISDTAGKRMAVIIPISEWELLTRKHADLKQLEQPQQDLPKMKASDYAGSLSEEGYQALSEHIKQARTEWDRNTF